jgi:RNA polymerase sigma-70 factor (ECF subfamily)
MSNAGAMMDRGPERIFDEYLVVMSQGGSREALAVLVGRWTPRLTRYVARTLRSADLVEDVVQEVWAAALRGLPQVTDAARFPAWIYAIATRKCADAVRGRVRVRRLADGLATERAVNGHAADMRPGAEQGLDLGAAIDRLPLDLRLTLSLHYGEDLSVEDVAAVLRVPAGTVKSRLHTARSTLRQLLEGDPP